MDNRCIGLEWFGVGQRVNRNIIFLCIWLILLLVKCNNVFAQYEYEGPISRPVEVFVNVYDHPKTGFSCLGKNPGEYYADPANKCAVYYVCIPNPNGLMSAQSFACPNGTIFSQATRVCRPHEEGKFELNFVFFPFFLGTSSFSLFYFHFDFSILIGILIQLD